jgi:hypothetical protein
MDRRHLHPKSLFLPSPPNRQAACAAMEMAVLSMVQHPNIVQMYAWCTDAAEPPAGEGRALTMAASACLPGTRHAARGLLHFTPKQSRSGRPVPPTHRPPQRGTRPPAPERSRPAPRPATSSCSSTATAAACEPPAPPRRAGPSGPLAAATPAGPTPARWRPRCWTRRAGWSSSTPWASPTGTSRWARRGAAGRPCGRARHPLSNGRQWVEWAFPA